MADSPIPILNGRAKLWVESDLWDRLRQGAEASGREGEDTSRLAGAATLALHESRNAGKSPSDPVSFSLLVKDSRVFQWRERTIEVRHYPYTREFWARIVD